MKYLPKVIIIALKSVRKHHSAKSSQNIETSYLIYLINEISGFCMIEPFGAYIYDDHKKGKFVTPRHPPPYPQKWAIDLFLKSNRIHKQVTNLKTPPTPFPLEVIIVWALIWMTFRNKLYDNENIYAGWRVSIK